MPDLPLDTLVIVGLVLASLIGRIFQQKQATTKKPTESSSDQSSSGEPSLDEALKRAFGQSESLEEDEHGDIVIPRLPIQLEQAAERESPPPSLPKPSNTPLSLEEGGEQRVPLESPRRRARRELFTTGDSLRKAFVLKEILDKPVTLRADR
jgi:hypothetical protein